MLRGVVCILVIALLRRTSGTFSCEEGKVLEKRICLPSDYVASQIPGEGTNVDTFMQIQSIPSVDEAAQTISINMYLCLTWSDPRIIIDSDNINGDSVIVSSSPITEGTIWKPDLFVYDLVKNKESKLLDPLSGLTIYKNKSLYYFTTITTTIGCLMNFEQFPIDTQECWYRLSSSNYPLSSLRFTPALLYEERKGQQSFTVSVSPLPESNWTVEADGITYTQVGFVVRLRRFSLPYVLQYYLPCGAMVAVSWISFLISVDVVPGRVALLVTVFLVLITLFGSIQSNTPKCYGLTALGIYALACLMFVFGAMLEYASLLFIRRRRLHLAAAGGPAPAFVRVAPANFVAKVENQVDDTEALFYAVDKWALLGIATLFVVFNAAYVAKYEWLD